MPFSEWKKYAIRRMKEWRRLMNEKKRHLKNEIRHLKKKTKHDTDNVKNLNNNNIPAKKRKKIYGRKERIHLNKKEWKKNGRK